MHMEHSAKEYARKIIIIRCDEHLFSEIQNKNSMCKIQDMKRKSQKFANRDLLMRTNCNIEPAYPKCIMGKKP